MCGIGTLNLNDGMDPPNGRNLLIELKAASGDIPLLLPFVIDISFLPQIDTTRLTHNAIVKWEASAAGSGSNCGPFMNTCSSYPT